MDVEKIVRNFPKTTIFKIDIVNGGCQKAYIHMVKIVLKLCGILKIATYHHATQPTFTAAHSIDIDLIIIFSLLTASLTYQYSIA